MSFRRGIDGSYIIFRSNRDLEATLYKTHTREPGADSIWYPRRTQELTLESFRNKHKGRIGYFVGKGPSLDKVDKTTFPRDAVIYCINNSIHKIESLKLPNSTYVVQQDMSLRDTCIPKKAIHLLSIHAKGWNPNAVLYDPENASSVTILLAMKLATVMGIKDFKLIAFDACKNKDTSYAEVIGGVPPNPKQFLKHREWIEAQCLTDDCKVEFI